MLKTAAAASRRLPRVNRRERHRAEIRDRLYRAALQLFAERGYLETTVEDITEAADVGKGTFFNYFPTKEHVLASFGGERIAAIRRAVERAGTHREPTLSVLKNLVTDLAGQSAESPALLRSIYAAHASCAPVRAELAMRLHESRRLMEKLFSLGQERKEVRSDRSAAVLARCTQLIFHGVILAWALNPDVPLSKAAEEVWSLFGPSLCVAKPRSDYRNRRRMRPSDR
jgi:AcrR family transcriptional regulator